MCDAMQQARAVPSMDSTERSQWFTLSQQAEGLRVVLRDGPENWRRPDLVEVDALMAKINAGIREIVLATPARLVEAVKEAQADAKVELTPQLATSREGAD